MALPVPVEAETVEISGIDPTPRLEILPLKLEGWPPSELIVGLVRMGYSEIGYLEPGDPDEISPELARVEGSRRIVLTRNLEEERRLFHSLKSLGLKSLGGLYAHWRLPDGHENALVLPPSEHPARAAWMFFMESHRADLEAAGLGNRDGGGGRTQDRRCERIRGGIGRGSRGGNRLVPV